MRKQKKGEATTKDKAITPVDISVLDIRLKQRQLANKISSKSKWQDSMKAVKSAIQKFEKSIQEMNPIKITDSNASEMNQKALALKMNLDIYYQKIQNLENSDIDDITDISPEEKTDFSRDLDEVRKAIKSKYKSHLHSLRKFLIGDSVLLLEAETNHLHFTMDQMRRNKAIEPKSQLCFLKELDGIMQKSSALSKELSDFEITIYDERMKNINKITLDIQHAVKPLSSKPPIPPKPPQHLLDALRASKSRKLQSPNKGQTDQILEHKSPVSSPITNKPPIPPKPRPLLVAHKPLATPTPKAPSSGSGYRQNILPQAKPIIVKPLSLKDICKKLIESITVDIGIKNPKVLKKFRQETLLKYKDKPLAFKQAITLALDMGVMQAYRRTYSKGSVGADDFTFDAKSEDAVRPLNTIIDYIHRDIVKDNRVLNADELRKLREAYLAAQNHIKKDHQKVVSDKSDRVLEVIRERILDIAIWKNNAPTPTKSTKPSR